MNHEDTDKSHAMTWMMCVLALPVLYVLSAPPVVFAAIRLSSAHAPPAWAMTYAEPYNYLLEQTALKGPLDRYADFWGALIWP